MKLLNYIMQQFSNKKIGIIIFSVFTICIIIYFKAFIYSTVNSINVTDAKDTINLLIQIEASVIAIIISLSLVAVQLASSSYSARAVEIFKKSVSFWFIVLLYIGLIVYGIVLTINIIDPLIIQNFIVIDYLLGIFAFLSLIPFIYNTLDVLKPTTIIKKLSKDITIEKILKHLDNENDNEDPIQPLIDIIQISLVKYDYRTLKDCLSEIEIHIDDILKTKELTNENQKKINIYLLKHFDRIADLAISRKDEDSLKEIIITSLKTSNIFNERWEFDKKILDKTLDFIKNIGDLALDQEMSIVVMLISISLCRIGEISIENEDTEIVRNVLLTLENIITVSIDKKMDVAAIKTADSIANIEKSIVDNSYEFMDPVYIIRPLFDFVQKAITDENDSLAVQLLEKLCKAAKYAIENQEATAMGFMPYYVKTLRELALEHRMIATVNYSGECLVNLFNSYMAYTEIHSISNVFDFIKTIAKNAIDEEYITKEPLINSLKTIVQNMEITKQKGFHSEFLEEAIDELKELLNPLEESIYNSDE